MAAAIISSGNSFLSSHFWRYLSSHSWLGGLLRTMIPSKILTVMAIVTVLPAANLASPLDCHFQIPYTPEQAFHEAYMPYEGKI